MSSLIPIGTYVLAKWPSTYNYYKARIIDHTDDNNYVCQFLDESVVALPSKYVDLPEKFQRTTKKLSLMHNEQMFLDRSLTFNSMIISLCWIAVFLYAQHCFYHYAESSNAALFEQYPLVVIKSLLLWFILQLVFARYFPHYGREQLVYIKESHPSIFYKHRSNSLLSFAITCLLMYLFREKISLRELTKSYYLLALFNLGIALTFSLILLTNKLFSRYCSIPVNENDPNQKQTQFDFHLFLSIRPGIILWPALNFLLFLTILKYNRQISIRFAISILLQTIYIINVFMNETSMIRQSLDISPPSSFDAIFTNLCWVPFMATLTSFYIGRSNRPVNTYSLFLAVILFIFGFVLQRLAMRQRSAFQAMDNTHLVDCVTVNDTQRILTDGCWRWCRHPHLLAELFMVIGWSLPAGVNHLSPWLYAFYIIGMAIYKAHYFDRALQNTCTEGAYERYIAHVKYTLIPFVY
ncbi:unnamed protein product [Rotaria magnacalcarata]|uniref:Tudor domain-containing protein n=3 Tax=Rotaria magnacalcarata TaxID=392030 RepID=A0A819KDZ6_9BILA|nr:unnamed protein product [Rotaria magnacalcarata]CAF2092883.1 unnamed protein product [Rotaria magnacalcarata]CAF3833762.1 unnamed protein product [Rotaria magnacalcarata]CAF3943943.1 unnamed protein product [Rotaria magnacalcarata]